MKLEKKYMVALGNYLRGVRLTYGLRQEDVRKALKLSSNQYISNIECGKCAPSTEYLKTLLKLTGNSKNEYITTIQQIYVDQIRETLK